MLQNEIMLAAQAKGFDSNESQGIATILDSAEVKTALEAAEASRKKKIGIYLAATVTVCGALIAAYGTDAAPVALIVFLLFTIILLAMFKGKAETNVKSTVISEFLKLMEKNSSYSTGKEHAFDFTTLAHNGFLNSYDRVDAEEDSFHFVHEKDGKSIDVRGMELRTSEIRGSGKNRRRVTTNQCFLLKGDYPETRFKISKRITIKGDMADSVAVQIASFLGPAAVFMFVANGNGAVKKVFATLENPFYASIAASLVLGTVTWHIARWFANNNRVKLENVAFEKLFDVKCEDQIMSRRVLTPAFMDRLVGFVAKTKGRYEFMFENETLYVKKFLNGSFLEINVMKNLSENVGMFIGWFAEIKEVVSLIADTGVLIYSRTDYEALGNQVKASNGRIAATETVQTLTASDFANPIAK